MKKVLFFLMTAALFSAQNVTFTDVNFKNAIIKAYPNVDANKDNEISLDEAKTLTSIRNLSSFPAITNGKGIEAFVNLTELDLGQKAITSIDVSANTKLTTLNLRDNKLAGTIDLSNLSVLKNLELNKNLLTEVILPVNGIIEILYCNENKLTQIDVSQLPNLKRLFLVTNEITSLDLSKNLILERLHIDNNKITGLNLSNLTKLNWMSVNNNLLTQITYSNNPLLKTILAQNNAIETLNFQDGFVNNITLINLTGNTNFNKIIKDCNDTLPTVSVTVEDNCIVLGTGETINNSLGIYPNPAVENLYFQKPIVVENYKIFNAEGKLIVSKNLNQETKSISVGFLPKGLYLLNIKTNLGEIKHRFLKK